MWIEQIPGYYFILNVLTRLTWWSHPTGTVYESLSNLSCDMWDPTSDSLPPEQANEAALIVSLQIDHHCLIIIMTVLTNYCFLCHLGGVLKRPSLFSKYQSKFKLNQKPEFGLWVSLKSYFILLQEDWSVCPSECRCTWSGGKRTAECQVRQNIERKIYCREKYIVEKNILHKILSSSG